jgi:hypothetical protein
MSSAAIIARNIFTKPVKPPGSVALTVDEDMTIKEIFEMLLMIFTEGMKILYAESDGTVNINARTEKDFIKVQEYFKSLGFICNYIIYLPSQAAVMDFETRKYNNITINEKTKLKDLRLPLKCGPRIFEISFDFYIPSSTK